MSVDPAAAARVTGPRRPLNPLARGLLVAAGSVLVAIGVVGIYLPGLPTTPFLLLAAACYARSSERLSNWLMSHRRIGPHLHAFRQHRAVKWEVKYGSLALAWAVLGSTALFVVESTFMKLLLVTLALVKTGVMLRLKTLP